jgi:phosphoglycolate phosphatase-like HAD superfamily hydrolase
LQIKQKEQSDIAIGLVNQPRYNFEMHVCLFDIDGTLLSSGGAGKSAIETALCEEFGVAMRGQVVYSGRTDRAIVRDLFQLHDVPETDENLQRLFQGYLQRLPACLAAHQGKVLPGIAELLAHLTAAGRFAVGLLTGNVRAGAKAKLGHYGLYDYFGFGGFGDEHFDRDEVAREALAAVREHLPVPVPPERIWVIGDTPLDVQCARAIGVNAIAVATGWHSNAELAASTPDLLLDDLSDSAPLMSLWNC